MTTNSPIVAVIFCFFRFFKNFFLCHGFRFLRQGAPNIVAQIWIILKWKREEKTIIFEEKKPCCCLCHTLVALSLLCPNHHMSQELNQRLSNQEKKEGTNCFTRMFIRQLFFCPLFWSRTKRHRPRPRNRVRILIASAHLRIASVPADGPSLAWTRHFLYSRLKIISSAFSTRTTKSIVLFITFATQPYCEPTSLFSPYETTSKTNSLLDTCEQKETKKKPKTKDNHRYNAISRIDGKKRNKTIKNGWKRENAENELNTRRALSLCFWICLPF